MSRSRRKTPIAGFCPSKGQKKFKICEHKRERRTAKTCIASGIYDDDRRFPHRKKYGNEWDSPRDGKCWNGHLKYGYCFLQRWTKEETIEIYNKLMRK